jgi:hypothetical protein
MLATSYLHRCHNKFKQKTKKKKKKKKKSNGEDASQVVEIENKYSGGI